MAECFFSRRNKVCKIIAVCNDKKLVFVYKKFLNGNPEKEYRNIEILSGINIPAVLARSEKALCSEYIEGQTLLQALETSEKQNHTFDRYIFLWIEFMQRFYKTMPGYIYKDINFRNFIVKDNCIYGVDLEEIQKGLPKTDIGRAVAFLLSYDPSFTEYKKQTAQTFISACSAAFCICPDDIRSEMHKELHSMQKRRGITVKADLLEGL